MNLIIWLGIGCLLGWWTSLLMKISARPHTIANLIVGAIGAFIGGGLVHLFFVGAARHGQSLNEPSFVGAFLGATTVLIVFNLVRSATAHHRIGH